MKRVLFITYYWPPSGGAGVQRGLKFVKYLPAFGVEPIVLTVDPGQASYPSLDASLNAEVGADVRVIRTRSFEPLRILAAVAGKQAVPHAGFAGSRREGLAQRAMRWVRGNWMLPDARRGWVKHAVEAADRTIREEGIDTILISSPPHSSQLIGLALKRRFPGLRWIADLRDPWTDIYFAKELMKGPRAERRDAAWEARVLQEADAVVVVGPSMKAAFAKRYGAEVERRIAVIPNGYDQADIARIPPAPARVGTFRITYVGTMAGSYDPRVLFAAARRMRGAATRPLELRFVGSIAPEVKALARAEGVDDLCSWLPPVPHDEALREMTAADMLLLVIPGGPGEERILTGKLFEYLAVRRPVLGIGPAGGDAGAILAECRAGRMFGRDEVDAVAAWIMGYAGTDAVAIRPGGGHERFERKVLTGELARLLVGPDGGPSAA
ncbi:MAG: glycosyltransferase family 4 protein [Bacteroidetes bacterium]|nr:glycosyltransferase family 4 protein [Bacteroidota bacterium]